MNLKGYVFDFKRFSTHDGHGIRTTVFLKGCTLNCVWCQNPEGISIKQRPLYFQNKCIHCNTCVHLAENGGVTEVDGKIKLDVSKVENWHYIIDSCPAVALTMDSTEMTSKEVVEEACKDAPMPIYKEAMKYIDYVYADLKIMDSNLHKKYTGVDNTRIVQNLKWLLMSEKKENVIIRTPLIPGMTATEENIAGIAKFISGLYPEVKYEILNPLAQAKYDMVDKEFCFKNNPPLYSDDQMRAFGKIATDNGVKNLILEI